MKPLILKKRRMRILIACEFSGIVRDAFLKRGHDAISCDLLPTERPGPHYKGDVLDIINDGWDMMIAHPPCTYLANSGVQHLHKRSDRWCQMDEGRLFFMKILNVPIKKKCIENPIPHSYCALPRYTQIIHPNHHGHEVTKRTCLWLFNLPTLKTTKIVGEGEKYFYKGRSNGSKWYQLSPGDKSKFRSITFQGIADAMATQWSEDLTSRSLL